MIEMNHPEAPSALPLKGGPCILRYRRTPADRRSRIRGVRLVAAGSCVAGRAKRGGATDSVRAASPVVGLCTVRALQRTGHAAALRASGPVLHLLQRCGQAPVTQIAQTAVVSTL